MRQRKLASDFNKSIIFKKNRPQKDVFLIGNDDYHVNHLFEKYYFNQKTAWGILEAEEIGNIGSIITDQKLGINVPLQTELKSMKVDLIISDINNPRGEIKIHVRVQKKSQVKNKIIIISGYKTF